VSRSLAERSWPGESPIGKLIFDGARAPYEWTVVGVVDDVRQKTLGAEPQPTFYRPLPQRPVTGLQLAVRVSGDPAEAIPALRRAIWSVDPSISIGASGVMSQLVRESEADDRFRALLLGAFAGLATALAAVGVFGVTTRGVAARTRELGIRSALGADASRLIGLVLRDGLVSAVAGVALGVVGAWTVAGALRGMLYGIEPHDPAVFAGVALFSVGVCLLAAWIPARRAARTDPREAMGQE
jgi:ABC-type antimicrobial peptide transport system permease subunit